MKILCSALFFIARLCAWLAMNLFLGAILGAFVAEFFQKCVAYDFGLTDIEAVSKVTFFNAFGFVTVLLCYLTFTQFFKPPSDDGGSFFI